MQTTPSSGRVLVLVGTKKGAFIFESDSNREKWLSRGPLFKGWSVMHMVQDPRDLRLHVSANHFVYGPSLHSSPDFGENWVQAAESPAFPRASISGRPYGTPAEVEAGTDGQNTPEKLIKIWNIQPGRDSEPDVLYAGGEPAALFKSEDRGNSWQLNESLYDHPHRPTWFPGNGGLCLHTVLLDPGNPDRMYVGISTGGCYRSDDGGQTWIPRNKNVRADFHPEVTPEYGQCVHKIDFHPSNPNVLYQQNHCGVYRSDNAGDDWIDIGDEKLPSRFGFPIAVHPHDPKTIYLVLEESDYYRMSIDGRFGVWRSRDAGDSWQRITAGLPENAHLVALREAMAVDNQASAGIYVGTNTGQVFYSRDDGDNWQLLADFLPPVLSVETAIIP